MPLNDRRWDGFVAAHPDATPLHTSAWVGFLADYYGFDGFALTRIVGGSITSGVPIIEVRIPPFRRSRWVSLPFSDACVPLVDESDASFVRDAAELRASLGVASLEVRAPVPGGLELDVGVRHELALDRDMEAIVRGYHRSVRYGIRLAQREGICVRRGETPRDLTHVFYGLHVRTRRRLGAPVQTRRYFGLLWERLIQSSSGFVLIAERQGVPLAAGVFLHNRRAMLYKYGASDERFWRLRANAALLHEAIGIAAADGLEVFDWGRTDHQDEGLKQFKASWGAVEAPLVYSSFGATAPGPRAAIALAGAGRTVIRRSPPVVCRTLGSLFYKFAA